MKRALTIAAAAKINLGLEIGAPRDDGYHPIASIFHSVGIEDEIACEVGDGEGIAVEGRFDCAPEATTVWKAARLFLERTGERCRVRLSVRKAIPAMAGLGGGSADAAAVLRLFGGTMADAAALGADVPACLLSRTSRGEGRGDAIEPLDLPGLSGTPVLLVNPNIPLATGPVFKAWDGVDRGPLGDWESGRNDLEAAARALVPEIGAVLEALAGARVARMSGSGATCFGLYDNEAARDAAATRIATERPGWWLSQTRLR